MRVFHQMRAAFLAPILPRVMKEQEIKKADLISMKNSHFDRTLRYTSPKKCNAYRSWWRTFMSLWPEAPFNINAACLCEEAAEPSINNKQSLGTKLKATISISSCISLHESNRDDFWGEMLHALNFLERRQKECCKSSTRR